MTGDSVILVQKFYDEGRRERPKVKIIKKTNKSDKEEKTVLIKRI